MAYINKNVSTMAMPSGMNRMGQFPLDMSSVYYSMDDLVAYATSGAIAYVGQVVSLVDEKNNKVTVYSIQDTAGTLKEVGAVPVDNTTIKIVDGKLVAVLPEVPEYAGDNESIDVGDYKISMHDFGKAYYEYVPEEKDEEGNVTKEASYAKVTVSEAKPWKAGLEPKVVTDDGKLVIGWFEPNPTTIEGVNDQVTALQGVVADHESRIGVLEGKEDENTTYSLTRNGMTLTLTPSEGDAQTVTIDAYSKQEIEDKFGALPEDKNTTYALTQDGMELTLTPSEGAAQTVTVDAYSKKEIDDKFDALPEDKDTTYSVKAGEKVLKLAGTEFSTEIGLKHENGKISLTGIGGEVIAEFSDAEFVADGVLEDVAYNAETKDLTFTWNVLVKDSDGKDVKKTDVVNIADLIDTYTAGDGIDLANAEFSIALHADSEDFLALEAEADGKKRIRLSGVQDAIDAALEEAKKYADDNDANTEYTAGDGLDLVGTEFAVKLDDDNESEFLTVSSNGIKLSGIRDAIADEISPTIDRVDVLEEDLSGVEDDLANLAEAIDVLNGAVDDEGSVAKQIAEAITAENLDQYVKNDEFNAVLVTVTDSIDTLDSELREQITTEVDTVNKTLSTRIEQVYDLGEERYVELYEMAESAILEVANIADDDELTSFSVVNDKLKNYATTAALTTAVNSLKETEIKVAQETATTAKTNAATAQGTADSALAKANTNAVNIAELDKSINGHTPDGGTHVDGLVQKVASNTTRIGTAEGKIVTLESASHTHAKTDAEISSAVDLKHSHTFVESELNQIKAGDVAKWNAAEQNAKTYAKNYADGLASNYADATHTHTKADITDFAHKHEIADVNGLSDALENIKKYADDNDANTTYGLTYSSEKKEIQLVGSDSTTTKITGTNVVDIIPENTYDAFGAAEAALTAAKKYADDNDADTKYGIIYDSENKKIKLVSDATKTEIDATAFIKDGMIESVALSADGLKLVITWNTDANKGENNVTEIPLSGLVDVYTGVDGTTVEVEVSSDNKISAEVKENSLKNAHIASDAAIAKSKLASDVQTSLGLADTAVQPSDLGTMAGETAADYIKKSEATGYGDILTKTAAQGLYQAKGDYASATQGAKADTAIQTVAAGTGLTATIDENDATKVTIAIDDSAVFIFAGGSATSAW